MGEGVGNDFAAAFLLEAVVADGIGCCEGFFDISFLQYALPAIGIMCPKTGLEIRL